MPKGEFISHVNPVRLRVAGEGNLKGTLYGLDDVDSSVLTPIELSTTTRQFEEYLSNFKGQQIALEIQVDQFGEWFRVLTITPYLKPVASSYPR